MKALKLYGFQMIKKRKMLHHTKPPSSRCLPVRTAGAPNVLNVAKPHVTKEASLLALASVPEQTLWAQRP